MNEHAQVPALRGGGHVSAIIPQSFEETWRISKAVLVAGLAPYALIGKKNGDDAVSAISVAIMSGAELGLPPMVALRSFTVINGKPALYGDGLINVVRRSGKVAYLRTGTDERDGKLVGWCEAKRNDTGEEKRVEFNQDQAERAGLWETQAKVRKQVWENGSKVWRDNVPNDSPWFKYPERMLQWRAAGFCLRELFGDVLGGVRDEFEAREIQDAEFEEVKTATPPSPPTPPSPSAKTEEDEPVTQSEHFDLEEYLGDLETDLNNATSDETVQEVWDQYDVEATLTGDEAALQRAFDLRKAKTDGLAAIANASAG